MAKLATASRFKAYGAIAAVGAVLAFLICYSTAAASSTITTVHSRQPVVTWVARWLQSWVTEPALRLDNPSAIAIDPRQRDSSVRPDLFVADLNNHRVVKIALHRPGGALFAIRTHHLKAAWRVTTQTDPGSHRTRRGPSETRQFNAR